MRFNKKILLCLLSILLISTCTLSSASYQLNSMNAQPISKTVSSYESISVEEAYNFLNSTDNGIQIPIDVRTDVEYANEHIDMPKPENARHHCVCEWGNDTIVQDFIDQYTGETIILYCLSGGRSASAADILVDNNFQGTIYNMLGGITAWKSAGYPTKENAAPSAPIIQGEQDGAIEESYTYTLRSIDPEDHDIYYYLNFSDGSESIYDGPFTSNESIYIDHIFTEKGTYIIKAKAYDIYNAESEWANLEVTMPKTKQSTTNVLLDLLHDFLLRLSNVLPWI